MQDWNPRSTDAVVDGIGNWAIVPLWVARHPSINAAALDVWIELAGHYRHLPMGAIPSRRQLADDIGCSVQTVDRGIATLTAIGALAVEPREDAQGDRTSNRYHLFPVHPEFRVEGGTKTGATPVPNLGLPRGTKTGTRIQKDSTDSEVPNPDDGFDAFWTGYPRHIGKAAARRVWLRLKPSAELRAQINAAVEVQKRSRQWTKDNGDFIPHAATWLHQQRWLDEVQPTTLSAAKRTRATNAAQLASDHDLNFGGE